MYDTDHSHTCKTHIRKDQEIPRLSNLIIYRMIRSNQKKQIRSFFHVAIQWRILCDLIRHLKIAGGFHCLDNKPIVVQIYRDPCRKCRFSCTRGTCNKDTALGKYPLFQFIAKPVLIQTYHSDRTHCRDLNIIRKRRVRDRDTHIPDLQDRSTFGCHLRKRFRIRACPLDQFP